LTFTTEKEPAVALVKVNWLVAVPNAGTVTVLMERHVPATGLHPTRSGSFMLIRGVTALALEDVLYQVTTIC
jgi:hypothetical protein